MLPRWAGTSGLGRTNLTTRYDTPAGGVQNIPGCVPRLPLAAAAPPHGATPPRRVSTSRPSMHEGRVPSRPWYEQLAERAKGVPAQGGRQLEVRIRRPASHEGRQDIRRCSKRVIKVS